MMYSSLVLTTFLATATATVAATAGNYTPARISYDELVAGVKNDDTGVANSKFWNVLQEVGMVSITDLPNFNKQRMFETMEGCIHTRKEITPAEFVIDDRTRRLTVATETEDRTMQDLFTAIPNKQSACVEFQDESKKFRGSIQKVSDAFANRLSLYSNTVPVLKNKEGFDFNIEEAISKGKHLEHFHSYYTTTSKQEKGDDSSTIDLHTDQGMVLLFTPGQQDDQVTSGFFIQLKDGTSVEVDFDANVDDVVVMLGDGMNQVFNNIVVDINNNGDNNKEEGHPQQNQALLPLRALPHALTLPPTSESGRPRIWYGRMVLPPSDAIVPASLEFYDNDNGSGMAYTFEDMRNGMIDDDVVAINLGCSSPTQVARELHVGDPDQCDKDTTIHCWMRCMDYNNTQYKDSCESEDGCNDFYMYNPGNVTPDSCMEEGMEALCMDDDGHEWINGLHDRSYYIQCGDSTSLTMATLKPTNSPTDSSAPTMTPEPTATPVPTEDHDSHDHSSHDHAGNETEVDTDEEYSSHDHGDVDEEDSAGFYTINGVAFAAATGAAVTLLSSLGPMICA